jgi:hypothetical protein
MTDQTGLFQKCINDVFQRDDICLSLSTGTPGPFRKITAMIMDSGGNVLGFAKIGETPLAIGRIKNEAKILQFIADSSLFVNKRKAKTVHVPKLLYAGEIGKGYVLIQSPAPFEGKSGSKYLDEDYNRILAALISNSAVTKKFNKSEFHIILKERITNYSLSYKDILQTGLKHLEEAIGEKEITFALSHGDFAPWNMVWGKDREEVFIYDWESAHPEAPAGIDLVHFLFQTGFLLKKLRGEKLFSYIVLNPFLSEYSFPSPDILVLFYCLYMAITEDEPQQLSPTAVERRQMIKTLVGRR